MVLVKMLKRRDASSVLVAVLLAIIISQPLQNDTARLANKIVGINGAGYGAGGGWKNQYLVPVVWAILQIIVLEILAWIYVWSQPRGNR